MSDGTELAELIVSVRERMLRAVKHAESEFASIRTGRASTTLVEKLPVEYYGSEVPLQQIASISVPEARVLLITPYDKSALKEIERSISGSDLGITPSNDGTVIRLSFPPLTEERRKEMVKVVKQRGEDGRVAVRGVRRSARHEVEQLEKSNGVTSDEVERLEKELDKITAEYVAELDKAIAHKEKELLEI